MALSNSAVQGGARAALGLPHRLTRDQGGVIEHARSRIGGVEARISVRERRGLSVCLVRSCQVRVTSTLEFHVLLEARAVRILTEGAPIIVLLGGSLTLGCSSAATAMHDLAVGCNRKFANYRSLALRSLVQGLPVVQSFHELWVIHELLLHRNALSVVHRTISVTQAVALHQVAHSGVS